MIGASARDREVEGYSIAGKGDLILCEMGGGQYHQQNSLLFGLTH